MVSISGIRGIVGESLTPDTVIKYASAFGRYCSETTAGPPVVAVGRDGRKSGEVVAGLIVSALRASGVAVRSLGICPTPTVQLAVEYGHAAGGISITASHNPIQWNGMKFIAPTGMFLDADENRTLWNLADSPPSYASWDTLGGMIDDEVWLQKHADAVFALPYLDVESVRSRKLKVVLDCVNAAGGMIVPAFLRSLGCEVIEMNCDVSGVFAHTPEPVPENLVDLGRRVREENADCGIAVDPDVDRLVFMMESGEPYGEEYTVTSAVRFVLEKSIGDRRTAPTVVVNLSTTRAVDDVAAEYGATVIRTPVGEINVAKRMKEVGAVVGGEGSGGVILPAVHLGRDAIVGIGLILQLLAESRGTLSQLKASLPRYSIAKGKIALGSRSPDAALAKIQVDYRGRGRITATDGVKIDFDDSWVHLRKSNTEPIIRVIAEGRDPEQARDLVTKFQDVLGAG